MKRIIGIILLLALTNAVYAETAPEEAWNKTFGGDGGERAWSVQQTSDGGYIIAGDARSYGAGGSDFWLVKTDSNGNKVWDKTFGGAGLEWACSVQQTSDGGYILAGRTDSYGAGGSDFWLVKTDSNGNKVWDKTFGGTAGDEAYDVQQTSDNGYILAGRTGSYGAGNGNFWLVKTDSKGNEQWNRTFSGTGPGEAESVQQTSDGGYILAGRTDSCSDRGFDFWLVKTDSNGNKTWDKTYGGTGRDTAYSVQQTSDRGYILAGATYSYGAGGSDFSDVWLVKTDSNGNKAWDKTFGGTARDEAYDVQQTSDGGYILAGQISSYGAGSWDFWLIKVGGVYTPTPTGSISVSSAPSGADIYLDGAYKGTTPATISDVTPGSHALKLEKYGYEEWLTSVQVTSGVTKSITAHLAHADVSPPAIRIDRIPESSRNVHHDNKSPLGRNAYNQGRSNRFKIKLRFRGTSDNSRANRTKRLFRNHTNHNQQRRGRHLYPIRGQPDRKPSDDRPVDLKASVWCLGHQQFIREIRIRNLHLHPDHRIRR
jgi:hypothetical protein